TIVNRSTSPFGAGWWLEGLEYLGYYDLGGANPHRQVVFHGDGSTTFYIYNSGTGSYVATDTTWANVVAYNSDSGFYYRNLYNGGEVRYNGGGQHIASLNALYQVTRYVWSGAYLDSLILPS